jgi:NAD(P)H-nitrite reductase large subunit
MEINKMSKTICYCKNVTKAEIEQAIEKGAKTLGDIQNMTVACTGGQCKELNSSEKCCSEDIKVMLNNNTSRANSHGCCCK